MAFCSSASRLYFLFCLLPFVLLLCEARPAAYLNGTSDILTNDGGTLKVLDPITTDEIPQGSASDGAGSGMNLPAILWMACAFVFGVPLAIAGVRLGRSTSGVGIGLALAVGVWASIINAVNENGISDIFIFVLTAILFAVGFVLGLIVHMYGLGAAALGIAGGISIGIRVMLMKNDLLIPIFYVNWLVCTACGVAGLLLVVWRERAGVIVGGSAAGSFLIGLGVDLLINKQSGMSRGLRYLFDRNSNHIVDIMGTGYSPPISTQVIMGVTIASILVFGFLQHKLFPGPFRNKTHRPSSIFSDDASIRERSWFQRLTGRRGNKPAVADPEKESDSTCALVPGDKTTSTSLQDVSSPVSPQEPYKDEPEGRPTEGTPTLGKIP
ncbi:hypothetical protein M0805_002684 [Coniferiporia weirii]|nr:hypothetical protein M0805_002684 [Coniferiporia weirii]